MAKHDSIFLQILKTLHNDLRTSRLGKTFTKESKELREFYLTEEQKQRLVGMKRFKGLLYISVWVIQAMFFKLTPWRRLLFVAGILLMINFHINTNDVRIDGSVILGGAALVLLIILELKDKLIAHDELKEGRHIQEMLMPERMPSLENWSVWLYTQSANEVCGDLIDFIRIDKERIGVAIADVSGKGLHAALLTTKLQSTLRALVDSFRSVTELVTRINVIFHRDSPSHMFASLLYAEFTEEGNTVTCVNAGHFPALLWRQGKIEEMEKGGVAIGLSSFSAYQEQRIDLQAGEFMLLYSDGVIEARNEAGEFFGHDRLITCVKTTQAAPRILGEHIIHRITEFAGSTPQSDDLSLVIIQKINKL